MEHSDCPKSPDGEHKPDWHTVTVCYVDIACELCGASGCVGSAKALEADIKWE